MSKESKLIRIKAAAKEIGVSDQLLRKWVDSGIMACVKLPSGERRFEQAEIDRVKKGMRKIDALKKAAISIVTNDPNNHISRLPGEWSLKQEDCKYHLFGDLHMDGGKGIKNITIEKITIVYCSDCGLIIAARDER